MKLGVFRYVIAFLFLLALAVVMQQTDEPFVYAIFAIVTLMGAMVLNAARAQIFAQHPQVLEMKTRPVASLLKEGAILVLLNLTVGHFAVQQMYGMERVLPIIVLAELALAILFFAKTLLRTVGSLILLIVVHKEMKSPDSYFTKEQLQKKLGSMLFIWVGLMFYSLFILLVVAAPTVALTGALLVTTMFSFVLVLNLSGEDVAKTRLQIVEVMRWSSYIIVVDLLLAWHVLSPVTAQLADIVSTIQLGIIGIISVIALWMVLRPKEETAYFIIQFMEEIPLEKDDEKKPASPEAPSS